MKRRIQPSPTYILMKRFIFFFFIFSFALSHGGADAQAQRNKNASSEVLSADLNQKNDRTSSRQSSVLPKTIEIMSFPKVSFGEQNNYFNDVTTLQYQISLLTILVERQQKNQQIQQAFLNIDIPYREIPPAQTICAELPRNNLCKKFYPELYSLETRPYDPSQISFQDFINQRQLPRPATQQKTPQPQKQVAKATHYLWTEITCFLDQCRAVLIPEKGGSRFTVRQGSVLPSGHRVLSIHHKEVVLEDKQGKKLKLSSAPSPDQGGSSSPLLTAQGGHGLRTTGFSVEKDVDDLISDLNTNADSEIAIIP